jgi:SAM-dependent methyltransferase
LEIGCGQGDTTAVLANMVGAQGRIVAVDLADPSYGAPSTLGQAARKITASPLGDRIEYHFNFDVLAAENAFPEDAFDAIVLAHCTWYFDSLDRLREVLTRIRPWSRRLCLSEWDLMPRSIDQLGHLLAVLIQGQVEAHKAFSLANVRSPYSREALGLILQESGWSVESETRVDASDLQDADWEIASCLADSLREAEELFLAPKLQALIASQIDVLRRLAADGPSHPLPSYALVAV